MGYVWVCFFLFSFRVCAWMCVVMLELWTWWCVGFDWERLYTEHSHTHTLSPVQSSGTTTKSEHGFIGCVAPREWLARRTSTPHTLLAYALWGWATTLLLLVYPFYLKLVCVLNLLKHYKSREFCLRALQFRYLGQSRAGPTICSNHWDVHTCGQMFSSYLCTVIIIFDK